MAVWLVAVVAAAAVKGPAPQARQLAVAGPLNVSSDRPLELRALAADLDFMERAGAVRVASATTDWLAPGHRHDRLQQHHLGLPVVGGELTRQYSGGIVTAVLGTLYRVDRNDTAARLAAEDISRQLRSKPGSQLLRTPQLKWLGQDDGSAGLVYEAFVKSELDARVHYLDADTGEELLSMSMVHRQSAVGEGAGVLGDRKKVSTNAGAGGFRLDDLHRPPVLQTIDLRGDVSRLDQLGLGANVGLNDIAFDTDNTWTDAGAVDAHTYAGWTYDFLYKRLGFRGLDNRDAPMVGTINLLSPEQCAMAPLAVVDRYCVNAFWVRPPFGPGGRGMMFFGSGLALNYQIGGQTVRQLAGALDIVAHELVHGVTGYTSALAYRNESGALNEAFSDMIGTAVEAFYHPRGPQYQGADYTLGEDVFRAVRAGARDGSRSMVTPSDYGDPDHYSQRRYVGSLDWDSGGVHINSGIANNAYYLAIEGGTHRSSGRSVTGVGFANREQIEKTFFRAFTMLLPASATFYQARLATIQSARDLYGTGSAAERAVIQAWDAVGVSSPAAALSTSFTPNPVPPVTLSCAGARPTFFMTVNVAEFQGVAFNVAGFDAFTYDSAGRLLFSETFSASTFASWFSDCGAGSTQIRAGATACARLCTSLGGRSAGVSVFRFRGTDMNGNPGTFVSDPLGLGMTVSGAPDDPSTAFGPVTLRKVGQ